MVVEAHYGKVAVSVVSPISINMMNLNMKAGVPTNAAGVSICDEDGSLDPRRNCCPANANHVPSVQVAQSVFKCQASYAGTGREALIPSPPSSSALALDAGAAP
jgi:hypothetical protein